MVDRSQNGTSKRLRRSLTCRGVMTFALFSASATFAKDQPPPAPTGTPVRAYAPLDTVVIDFMHRCDCRSATAAVSHDGKLVFSRGYGWSDAAEKKRTPPDALLRIGGVTQPFTAAAVRKLVRDGKISLDTKAFKYLNLKPLRFANPDPRLNDITVGDLLEHRGGWGPRSFDPLTDLKAVEKALKVTRRPRPVEIVRYMMSEPLQFDPGAEKVFSNVGYCVLGRIIEKASGKPYASYIKDGLLAPLAIEDVRPGRHFADQRDPREVWYPVKGVPIETMDSFGGLVASAPALCTFLDGYWANGQPRQPGDDEQWTYFGNVVGTTAIVRERSDGYNIAVIFAVRGTAPLSEKDDRALERQIDEAIDKAAASETK
jgi:CubicO group peptidase (beta-lactamase class C family)